MRQEWIILYDAMIREIRTLKSEPGDPKIKIETCFSIAQQCWSQIQQSVEENPFESKKEEIEYYKEIKPLFKSEIEYYNLVYHAEIFKPLTIPGEMKEFWIKEQQKLNRFIQDHEQFYTYYKNGSTSCDEMYFLTPDQNVYYDDLIAQLLALERYNAYTQNELSNIR